ncbi:hypothetical protein NYE69_26400 [Paenibacillus sp. FSL R5-0527]|uniref:hypothetical protein n=1 Tax=Paenibacillus sp. FSL R5-0527 TaxID=2975321 RepID=UPI0030FA6470
MGVVNSGAFFLWDVLKGGGGAEKYIEGDEIYVTELKLSFRSGLRDFFSSSE